MYCSVLHYSRYLKTRTGGRSGKRKTLKTIKILALSLGLLGGLICSWHPVAATAPYGASTVVGQPNFAQGTVSATGFDGESQTVVDAVQHRLFVADGANSRVLVFNLTVSNQLVDRTADFVIGQSLFTTNVQRCGTGIADASHFCQVKELAIDSSGNRLFVIDIFNYRVLEFDVATISNGEAAIAVLGQPDFTTAEFPDTTAQAFTQATDLAVDSVHHHLFVADAASNRVLVFNLDSSNDPSDGTADNVLGQANFTDNATQPIAANTFNGIAGVDGIQLGIDATGNRLAVNDPGYERILLFDISSLSDNENAVGLIGQATFTTTGVCGPTATTICTNDGNSDNKPIFDSTNHRLFVASRFAFRVLVFNLDTNNDPVDGTADKVLGQPDFTSQNSCTATITSDQLCEPIAVSIDTDGQQLYVSEGGYRILAFDVSSITNNESAINVVGQTDDDGNGLFSTLVANNRSATAKRLKKPDATIIDTVHHRLFVADSGNDRVLIYNLDTDNTMIDDVADYELGQPDFTTETPGVVNITTDQNLRCENDCGLAYDPVRNLLFVNDYYRVMIFDVATISNGEAAIHELGQPDFTTANCSTTQQDMCAIVGTMTYDIDNQRLFVPDGGANRIMVFDVSTIADYMNADFVLGQPDFSSSSSGTSQTELAMNFTGLVYQAPTHRLFVSDFSNNRVMVFDVNPGSMSNGEPAAFVLGQPNFTSSSGTTTAGGLWLPVGLAIDEQRQQLFVQELHNERIMVFDVSSLSNGKNASAVIGAPNFTTIGNFNTISAATFNPISHMGFDPSLRRLYVPDTNNQRLLAFDFIRMTKTSVSNGVVGTSYNDTITTAGEQGNRSFAVTSGSLPPGISLNSSNGTLSGSPTTAGLYTFAVSVTDANSTAGSYVDSSSYSIDVSPGAGSGGSGNGGGSSGATQTPSAGDGNSFTPPPGVPTSEPTPTSPESVPPSSEPVILNELPGYFNNGVSLTLTPGETVAFCPGNSTQCDLDALHQITLTGVNHAADVADLQFTPNDQNVTLLLNQGRDVDVNNDAVHDIRLLLTSTAKDSATITFRKSSAVVTPAAAGTRSTDFWHQLAQSVPKLVLVGFPYLLFIILAMAMIVLLLILKREARLVTQLQQLYQRQAALLTQKETFRQLAEHYLRTPVTLIRSSLELAQGPAATASAVADKELLTVLGPLAADLGKRAEMVLADIAAANQLPIRAFTAESVSPSQLLRRPAFLLPLGLLALLVALFDLLAVLASADNLWWITPAIHLALALLSGIGLYALLRRRLVRRQLHTYISEALLAQKQFDDERNRLIEQAATSLQASVAQLQTRISQLRNPLAQSAAQKGVNNLATLLDRFKLAARLPLSTLPPTIQRANLAELSTLTTRMQTIAQEKQLAVSLPQTGEISAANMQLLRYVLLTLLDNAIAYSDKGDAVDLTARPNHDQILLTVTDHGRGMPAEYANQWFTPFSKAEGALDFSHEGAGFSLYLDKLIMTYLGGDIALASSPGQGTQATVTVPLT